MIYYSVLIYASFIDIKIKEVTKFTYGMLVVLYILIVFQEFSVAVNNLVSAVIITIPILILAVIKNSLGGGDVKFIFLNALILGGMDVLQSLFLGAVVLIIKYLIEKYIVKKTLDQMIPLIPYISIGCMVIFLCKKL